MKICMNDENIENRRILSISWIKKLEIGFKDSGGQRGVELFRGFRIFEFPTVRSRSNEIRFEIKSTQ